MALALHPVHGEVPAMTNEHIQRIRSVYETNDLPSIMDRYGQALNIERGIDSLKEKL